MDTLSYIMGTVVLLFMMGQFIVDGILNERDFKKSQEQDKHSVK